jgi:hypothetical protein
MSSPPWLLKSSWIPNNSLELFICSISLLLLLLAAACCCCCCLPSAQLLFAGSLCADLQHQPSDLSITSSSCSNGWLCSCSLLCCNFFCKWVDHHDLPCHLLHPLWHLSCHSAADSISAVSSLSCCQLLFVTVLLLPFSLWYVSSFSPAAPWAGILLHHLLPT